MQKLSNLCYYKPFLKNLLTKKYGETLVKKINSMYGIYVIKTKVSVGIKNANF